MINDLRFAWHLACKNPGFPVVVIVTLALGIGLDASMFSLANTFLWRTLPFPNANRLVRVFGSSAESRYWGFCYQDFQSLRQTDTGFEAFGVMTWSSATLKEPDRLAEVLQVLRVTPDFLPAIGVRPLMGRWFHPEEDHEKPDVVILSHALWKERFGGDPQIIGRAIRLDERQFTVVGVMPPKMAAPLVFGKVELWQPLGADEGDRMFGNSFQAVARLRPNDPLSHANAVLRTIAERMEREKPKSGQPQLRRNWTSLWALPLQASSLDDTGRELVLVTNGLAALVLLIACANLANLQLARAAGRYREFAVRVALGASRWRLIRLLVIESLVLSLVGGALALCLADGCGRLVGSQYKFWFGTGGQEFPVDWRVVLFAAGVATVTGIFFGALPGWLTTRVNLGAALKDCGRGTTVSRGGRGLRYALVVAEFAIALILLAGSAFLYDGVRRFMRRDVGWRPDDVAYAYVWLNVPRYNGGGRKCLDFFEHLRDRIAVLPGVKEATFAADVPVWGGWDTRPTMVDGRPESDPARLPRPFYLPVDVAFFKTLGVPLIEGRFFDQRDRGLFEDPVTHEGDPNAIHVAIINLTMARALWPGESAVGKRISHLGGISMAKRCTYEIVGVVGEVQFAANLTPPVTRFQVYRPFAQESWPVAAMIMRTDVRPEALLEPFRRALAEIDPEIPVNYSNTASGDVEMSTANIRLTLKMLAATAFLGLFLAALGLYAVMAQISQHRMPEIGVRIAMGAQTSDIIRLTLGQGLRMASFGTMIGLVGVIGVGRLIGHFFPEMPGASPILAGTLTVVLVAVAVLATWLPAHRAANIDPLIALRSE